MSLFSGYGGLDLALHEVLGAETVAVADVCKVNKDGTVGHHDPHRSPCSILAHRFPGVPNLGDVSLIDWTPWRGRVDVIAAGFPCQDVSVAGNRAGLRDGTRTGLWSQVVRAITELSPRLVALENVPGIFTAPAASDVEPCPICLGERPGDHLRALDAVLADLAAIGLDADWTVVPASGVGAAHKRERWFCLAYPAGQPWGFDHGDGGAAADAGHRAADWERARAELGQGSGALLPSPRTSDTNGAGHHGDGGMDLRTAVADLPLLPTPAAERGGRNNKSASEGAAIRWGLDYIDRLLPTPTAGDSKQSGASGYDSGHDGTTLTDATVRQSDRWGEYGPAIRRWESLTRPAPEPTKLNAKGNPKLSDEFDEWLMGLPAGWITDVPGVTWNETLKACGNGVVPQQAVAAIWWLLSLDDLGVAAA